MSKKKSGNNQFAGKGEYRKQFGWKFYKKVKGTSPEFGFKDDGAKVSGVSASQYGGKLATQIFQADTVSINQANKSFVLERTQSVNNIMDTLDKELPKLIKNEKSEIQELMNKSKEGAKLSNSFVKSLNKDLEKYSNDKDFQKFKNLSKNEQEKEVQEIIKKEARLRMDIFLMKGYEKQQQNSKTGLVGQDHTNWEKIKKRYNIKNANELEDIDNKNQVKQSLSLHKELDSNEYKDILKNKKKQLKLIEKAKTQKIKKEIAETIANEVKDFNNLANFKSKILSIASEITSKNLSLSNQDVGIINNVNKKASSKNKEKQIKNILRG